MSLQSDLETGLLALLKAEPGLATVATFEADVRDCLFGDASAMISGFRPTELPAVNLTGQIDPTASSQFTAGEIQHDVPFSIVVICKAQDRATARGYVKGLQDGVESVLNALRRSGNALGQNAIVMGDLSSSAIAIQHSPHCFAVGTTAVKIKKITATP